MTGALGDPSPENAPARALLGVVVGGLDARGVEEPEHRAPVPEEVAAHRGPATVLVLLGAAGAEAPEGLDERLGGGQERVACDLASLEGVPVVEEAMCALERRAGGLDPLRAGLTWSWPAAGLEEHVVWNEVARQPAVAALGAEARDSAQYALTAMVNNAIDHASANRVVVSLDPRPDRLRMTIEDDGEGAFAHVRALAGLERFREVTVDFAGIAGIGQGFADEVFRVWPAAHPDTRVLPANMGSAVAFMVRRATA